MNTITENIEGTHHVAQTDTHAWRPDVWTRVVYAVLLVAVWPCVVYGFVMDEFFPAVNVDCLRPWLWFGANCLIIITGMALMRNRRDWAVLLVFGVIAITSAFVNDTGFKVFISGCRDYVGLVFVMPILRYLLSGERRQWFMARFDRQCLVYLGLQFACIFWQYFRYGANDHGGGTWGNGFSGVVSVSIYLLSFTLMAHRWNKRRTYLCNITANWVMLLMLLPTFFNETKISFVLLAMYLVLLIPFNRHFLRRVTVMMPVVVLMSVLFACAFVLTTNKLDKLQIAVNEVQMNFVNDDREQLIIEDVRNYYYDHSYETHTQWVTDLPRLTKIRLSDDMMNNATGGWLLGAGVGQIRRTSFVEPTPFYKKYAWVLQGTRLGYIQVLVHLGLIGIAWLLMTMVFATGVANHNGPLGINTKVLFVMLFVITLFYADVLRITPFMVLLLYSVACTSVAPGADGDYRRLWWRRLLRRA